MSKKLTLVEPVQAEVLPTIQEANQMFIDRSDLASVKTDQGLLHRDGTLI